MRATPKNMKICEHQKIPILAYSFETGEEFSACSGDYFLLDENTCLKDSEGFDMELVQKLETVVRLPIDLDDQE